MKLKKPSKKAMKWIKILLVWTVVSLVLQLGCYAALNQQVAKVLNPDLPSTQTVVQTLNATIPDTGIENVQLSYEKDYLAYTVNDTLKVLNLKTSKVVFEKASPSADANALGVLAYQWLPDRNTLIYFYGKKNPTPTTTTTVTVPVESTSSNSSTSQNFGSEDPNSKKNNSQPKQETRTKTIYHNQRLVDLYTLTFPESDDPTPPEDRYNLTLEENLFPDGAKIKQMVISTFTNLIYLSLNSDNGMKLLEIDVMKDSYTLNKSGETIGNMVASDRHGTLYIESKTDGQRKFLALWDNDNSSGEREFHRQTVMEDGTDNILLGDREGKLYIGEIKGNQLVKIKQAEESSDHNPLEFTTFWEGQIPYDMDAQVLIGERGQVIMYNQKSAYIIENKQEKEVSLSGDENFISPDGLQLAEFTHQSGSIAVKLSPLDKDKNVVKK